MAVKEAPGGDAVLKQLKSEMETGTLGGAILLFGREQYLVKNAIDSLIDRYINPAVKELDYTRLEGTNLNVRTLVEQCETLPVFSEKRVVLVSGFPLIEGKQAKGISEADEAELAGYVKKLPDSTLLVFASEKADKRTKFFKAVPKTFEFGPVGRPALERFAKKTLGTFGKTMDANAFRLLLELTGYYPDAFRKTSQREYEYTLYNLENDLKKLAGQAEGPTVTAEDVEILAGSNLETDVFRILDSAFEGNKGESLFQLRTLLHSGESAYKILGLLVSQLEIMTVVKEMQEELRSLPEMVSVLGVHEFRVKKSLPLVRNTSSGHLETLFRFALEIDHNIKTGQMEGPVALELLLAQI